MPARESGLISTLMPRLRLILPPVFVCLAAVSSLAFDPGPIGWPAAQRDHKPWTRWWWPASAVDQASLTRQLELIAAADLGGVEITPIYGAQGDEDRYIDFLSPKWMEMLEHTGREAQRLHLGVDMATGTGWPFGGPGVTPEDSNSAIALVAGRLAGEPTKMMVKRAAPGGEGLVLDPYSPDAIAPLPRALYERLRTLPPATRARTVPRLVRVLRRGLDAEAAGGIPADARLRHPGLRRRAARGQGDRPAHARRASRATTAKRSPGSISTISTRG